MKKFIAFQAIAMALYHFYLPYQFQWFNFLDQTSPTINWALIALNNYFSFNLLVLGLAVLFYKKSKLPVLLLTIFWTFSFIYQIYSPMPIPKHLNFLVWLLPSLALGNAFLALVYIWKNR
ncbi:MAG: hypothetical protein ACPGRE_10000 [Flavobacteriaceae bacterium]